MNQKMEFVRLQMELAPLHRLCLRELLPQRELHRGQTPLLLMLRHHGPCSQVELAKVLRVSPPSIAVSLKRMERAGYLRRVSVPGDLRTNRVELTPSGEGMARAAEQAVRNLEERMLTGFSTEDKQTLYLLLGRVKENLEKCAAKISETGESD